MKCQRVNFFSEARFKLDLYYCCNIFGFYSNFRVKNKFWKLLMKFDFIRNFHNEIRFHDDQMNEFALQSEVKAF